MTTSDSLFLQRLRADRRSSGTCYDCDTPAVSDSACPYHLLLRRVRWRLRNGLAPTMAKPRGRRPLLGDHELISMLRPEQRAEIDRLTTTHRGTE